MFEMVAQVERREDGTLLNKELLEEELGKGRGRHGWKIWRRI